MKKKEIQALRTKTLVELSTLMEKSEKELVQLKVDFGAGKLKNTCQLAQKRHDLARIKTILKELERNETI